MRASLVLDSAFAKPYTVDVSELGVCSIKTHNYCIVQFTILAHDVYIP